MSILVAAILALCSFSPTCAKARPPAGDAPFRLPDGWRWEPAPSGLWQARRELGDGYAVIQASRLRPDGGSLEASLDKVLAGAAGSPPAERGEGVTAWGQPLVYWEWAGTADVLDAVALDAAASSDTAVQLRSSQSRTVLTLRGFNLRPSRVLWARDDFDRAVRSVHARAAMPLPPLPPDAGGLAGVVTGLNFLQRPDGEGDIDTKADPWVLCFDPAGRFSRMPPNEEGGITGYCRTDPGECGTYQLRGGGWFRQPDRIVLREGSGRYGTLQTRELPFAHSGKDLVIGDVHLTQAALLPQGTLFEGTWTFDFDSAPGMVHSEITFRRDGHFRQAELDGYELGKGVETRFVTGRYVVDGTRLLLDEDDGQHASLGIVQPDANTDSVLIIDGHGYVKRAQE